MNADRNLVETVFFICHLSPVRGQTAIPFVASRGTNLLAYYDMEIVTRKTEFGECKPIKAQIS